MKKLNYKINEDFILRMARLIELRSQNVPGAAELVQEYNDLIVEQIQMKSNLAYISTKFNEQKKRATKLFEGRAGIIIEED